jgi:hypothetical protein
MRMASITRISRKTKITIPINTGIVEIISFMVNSHPMG